MKILANEISDILKYHTNYPKRRIKKHNPSFYLESMDKLASKYPGTLNEKIGALLNDYYKYIGVENLKEAHNYILKGDIYE